MGSMNLIRIPSGEYRVTMVKTVNALGPIAYRIANVSTLDSEDVAAPDVFDRIINDGWHIKNLRCEHGELKLVDDLGYYSADNVIVVDEFQEAPSLYDFCLVNEEYKYLLEDYSVSNSMSINSIKIDSKEKVRWVCDEGHQLYCDISTRVSLGTECVFCSSERENRMYSLDTWCHYTGNLDVKASFGMASNTSTAKDVIYKTHKKIILNGTIVSIDTYAEKLMKENKKRKKGE